MQKTKKMIASLLSLSLFVGTTSMAMGETLPPSGGEATTKVAVSAEAQAMVADGNYAKDEIIVVFDDSISDSKIENTVEDQDGEVIKIVEATDSEKIAVAEIDKGDTVGEAITKLESEPKVLFAQPNYKYAVEAKDPYNNDDPMSQWYLNNIKARSAWKKIGSPVKKTKVAVIDTGVDINHVDLQKNLNKKLSLKTNTMGGFKPLTRDSDSHGTHVSGIIAGTYDNGKGIAGVAAGSGNNAVELMVFDASSKYYGELYLDTFNAVDAINQAVKQKAKVINMSFGGLGRDRVLEKATTAAYEQGVVLVAAAGNENTDEQVNPSDFGEVISVCNTTIDNKRYSEYEHGSNFGIAKDISAPGTNIKSTVPGNRYDNYSGTSMSSPIVAAVAAMVLSVKPDLTPMQVKNILCGTAKDLQDPGFDPYTGYGLVDADAAVTAAKNSSKTIAATSLSLKESNVYMNLLDTHTIESLVRPATSLKAITWSSSDSTKVSVDGYGRITAKKVGDAVITAHVDGVADRTCKVFVLPTPMPEELIITNANDAKIIGVGDGEYRNAEVRPYNARDKGVYWESNKKTVATVAEDGYLEGKAPGTATIRGFTYNGVEVIHTVRVKPQVSKVTLKAKPTSAKVKMGTKFTFAATTAPAGAINSQIIWSSSNRSIATINSKTGLLMPKKPGKTTIIAKTKNGHSAALRITIFNTKYSGKAYGLKASASSNKRIKLGWKTILNADGYQVYRSTNGGKSYKKVKTLGPKAKQYTNTKLTKGKKYYYKVRAYYTVGGKNLYCGYSKVIGKKAK